MDSWSIELKPAPLCPRPASPPSPRLHSLPRSPPGQYPAKSTFLLKADDLDDHDDPDDHDYHEDLTKVDSALPAAPSSFEQLASWQSLLHTQVSFFLLDVQLFSYLDESDSYSMSRY